MRLKGRAPELFAWRASSWKPLLGGFSKLDLLRTEPHGPYVAPRGLAHGRGGRSKDGLGGRGRGQVPRIDRDSRSEQNYPREAQEFGHPCIRALELLQGKGRLCPPGDSADVPQGGSLQIPSRAQMALSNLFCTREAARAKWAALIAEAATPCPWCTPGGIKPFPNSSSSLSLTKQRVPKPLGVAANQDRFSGGTPGRRREPRLRHKKLPPLTHTRAMTRTSPRNGMFFTGPLLNEPMAFHYDLRLWNCRVGCGAGTLSSGLGGSKPNGFK